MNKRLVIALCLVASHACGDNIVPPDAPPDDGYGTPCQVSFDGRLYTTCESLLGQQGLCVQIVTGNPAGICRRWCAADGTCPQDQAAILTVGNRCFCQP